MFRRKDTPDASDVLVLDTFGDEFDEREYMHDPQVVRFLERVTLVARLTSDDYTPNGNACYKCQDRYRVNSVVINGVHHLYCNACTIDKLRNLAFDLGKDTPPNASLLLRTLSRIYADPHRWRQRAWRCKVGMCAAGHAVTEVGIPWAVSVVDSQYDNMAEWVNLTPLVCVPASVAGALVLHLDNTQANELFTGNNDLAHLNAQVQQLLTVSAADLEAHRDEWASPPAR